MKQESPEGNPGKVDEAGRSSRRKAHRIPVVDPALMNLFFRFMFLLDFSSAGCRFPSLSFSCKENLIRAFFRCCSGCQMRNLSCPVSPIGSPLPGPFAAHHASGRLSPSPISSPRTASGSSTPLTGGTPRPPGFLADGAARAQKVPPGVHANDPGLELYWGMPQQERASGRIVLSDQVSKQLLQEQVKPKPQPPPLPPPLGPGQAMGI